MNKTPGQVAYEKELLLIPFYHDGTRRPSWEKLPHYAQKTWEENPTPRFSEKSLKTLAERKNNV